MRTEPGAVLGDLLQRTGGVYTTTTRLTPKFREDIREIAELTSDDQLRRIAELAEVPVSLEHLRHVDPQTRIIVGYRLDVTPAESSRLRRRLALPPGPRIMLHFDEVPFPGTPGKVLGRYAPRHAWPEHQRSSGSASPLRAWPAHCRCMSPRCPRTAINSQRLPPAAPCGNEASLPLNPRATRENTLVMRRSGVPVACPMERQTTGNHGHWRTGASIDHLG